MLCKDNLMVGVNELRIAAQKIRFVKTRIKLFMIDWKTTDCAESQKTFQQKKLTLYLSMTHVKIAW